MLARRLGAIPSTLISRRVQRLSFSPSTHGTTSIALPWMAPWLKVLPAWFITCVQNLDPLNYNPKDPVSGMSAVPRNMTGVAEVMQRAGCAHTHLIVCPTPLACTYL